jgi:hypothetical protein
VRLPMPTRRVIAQARPAEAATVPPQQVGRDPTLVEKDVPLRVAEGEPLSPPPPLSRDVGAPLFVGVNRFF